MAEALTNAPVPTTKPEAEDKPKKSLLGLSFLDNYPTCRCCGRWGC